MMQSLVILGRQPELGLAELESLYGHEKVTYINNHGAIIDVDPCLFAYDRLGGSLKFCKVLTELKSDKLADIEDFLVKVSPDHSLKMPAGKMTLGLSYYGFSITPKQIIKIGFNIKKAISKTGRSVRFVPNKETFLNTAQVLHNRLLRDTGWELVILKNKSRALVAQTVKVQDIESYTKRDQARPKRDAKVGMLPPKLAQIIINLAVGLLPDEARQSVCDIPPDEPIPLVHLNKTILDPFCGTGVILQEALLMGYKVYGTDIDERLISFTKENLAWLINKHSALKDKDVTLELADALKYSWHGFDFIASEIALGKPFSAPPAEPELKAEVSKCNLLLGSFLKNLHPQLNPGKRICLAVPAWQIKPGVFKSLPLIDQISDLGYNQVQFKSVNRRLIYARPGQIVARELLTLTRK